MNAIDIINQRFIGFIKNYKQYQKFVNPLKDYFQ